jgi:hypothetical protein
MAAPHVCMAARRHDAPRNGGTARRHSGRTARRHGSTALRTAARRHRTSAPDVAIVADCHVHVCTSARRDGRAAARRQRTAARPHSGTALYVEMDRTAARQHSSTAARPHGRPVAARVVAARRDGRTGRRLRGSSARRLGETSARRNNRAARRLRGETQPRGRTATAASSRESAETAARWLRGETAARNGLSPDCTAARLHTAARPCGETAARRGGETTACRNIRAERQPRGDYTTRVECLVSRAVAAWRDGSTAAGARWLCGEAAARRDDRAAMKAAAAVAFGGGLSPNSAIRDCGGPLKAPRRLFGSFGILLSASIRQQLQDG